MDCTLIVLVMYEDAPACVFMCRIFRIVLRYRLFHRVVPVIVKIL